MSPFLTNCTCRHRYQRDCPGRCVILISLLLAGCSGSNSTQQVEGDAQAAAPPPPRAALVRVSPVRFEQIAPRLVAVGTVRPRRVSIVASAADGIVDEFPLEKGIFVKEKSVLSRLRTLSTDLALDEQRALLTEREAMYQQTLKPRKEDVDEAKALQMVTQASLENAQRRFAELKSLVERGATNQSAVDDAADLLVEARNRALATKAIAARVASGTREEEKLQAKARLEAQQKHVAWLEAEKEKRVTRAPFDGFIVSEETYPGQWLSKGDPVVTMAMLDEVDVEVPVDQSFISQIALGTSVRLMVSGTPDSSTEDGRWTGTISSIVPRSEWESGSRSFPVIVRVTNRMNGTPHAPMPTLREGMMAEVEFFGAPLQAKMVPKDSLVRTSRGTFVFAVNSQEEGQPLNVRRVLVEPGIAEEGEVQVTTDELLPDTLVVTEGAERLRPFQTVSIIEEAAE